MSLFLSILAIRSCVGFPMVADKHNCVVLAEGSQLVEMDRDHGLHPIAISFQKKQHICLETFIFKGSENPMQNAQILRSVWPHRLWEV